jgi:hypothetical protein
MLEASAGRRLDIGAAGQVENKIGAMDFTVRPADLPSWSSICARDGMYLLTRILGDFPHGAAPSKFVRRHFAALLGHRESRLIPDMQLSGSPQDRQMETHTLACAGPKEMPKREHAVLVAGRWRRQHDVWVLAKGLTLRSGTHKITPRTIVPKSFHVLANYGDVLLIEYTHVRRVKCADVGQLLPRLARLFCRVHKE